MEWEVKREKTYDDIVFSVEKYEVILDRILFKTHYGGIFMADSYIGEIRMFAGPRLPRGWLACDGRWVNVSQYESLFALIGTTYGGDGVTQFALPDMRGRLPIGSGSGTGLTPRILAQKGGGEMVSLVENQIPAHTHATNASTVSGSQSNPDGGVWAATINNTTQTAVNQYVKKSEVLSPKKTGAMDPLAISAEGGGNPHDNVMPYLIVNYMISTIGVFPTPS